MPKVDQTVEKIFLDGINETHFKRAYLFVNQQKQPYWWLRLDLHGSQQVIRSTKVSYQGEASSAEALEKAFEIYKEIDYRLEAELAPKGPTIPFLIREYLKTAKEGYEINEALDEPVERSIFGAFWNRKNYLMYLGFYEKTILPFFNKQEYRTKLIFKISQTDINKWMVWRARTFKNKYAPSSIQKQDTCLRAIFEYAREIKGERFVPPKIKSPQAQLIKRRRPEIDDEKFFALQQHLRGKFHKELNYPLQMVPLKAEQAFLFYCWLETLEHTAIRPWSSAAHAIHMSDIHREKTLDGKVMLLLDRREKGKIYTASATQYWIHTLNRLDAFYAARGMEKRDWLLAHTRSKPSLGIKKGDPIGSFKSSWNTAINYLEFNDASLPKNQRYTPYAIRHRAIGRMLRENPDISVIEIASSVGSSLEMVSKIYHHYNVRRNYEKLMLNTIDYTKNIDVFSESGGWIEVIAINSQKHKQLYEENPRLVRGIKPKG